MKSRAIEKWSERYQAGEQVLKSPAPLVVEFAGGLTPGSALDLACGPGRNALFLAERGWRVTAVDGSPVAIDLLRAQAHERIDARVVDLETSEFEIEPETFDLVLSCCYLQRSLIPSMKSALRAGGLLIMLVLLDPPPGTPTRAYPGELAKLFNGWRILRYTEGEPGIAGSSRAIAELVAQKTA